MAVMTYEGFISTVQEVAHIPTDEAERSACATLQTLSERVSAGETEDIAERLPDRLRSCLSTGDGPAATFHADEFVRRVAERADVDEPAAHRDARAVFSALFHSVGPEEFYDLRSELPSDFDPLLDEATTTASTLTPAESEAKPGVSFGAFIQRVADRLDVDRQAAQRAAETVLEVLGIRISGGQVEDLAGRLPAELRAPLERGVAESGRAATAMSVDDFLRQIARRRDVSIDEAGDDVRAVMTTLREAVGEKEFRDTLRQLPDEYAALLRYQG
jgi:uncharacterized protein (DUF2267 family)